MRKSAQKHSLLYLKYYLTLKSYKIGDFAKTLLSQKCTILKSGGIGYLAKAMVKENREK